MRTIGLTKGVSLMKASKTQAVLLLYDLFLMKGELRKKDYLQILEMSDISFKRYVSELRCYFANFGERYEVLYDRKHDLYKLIKSKAPH
jgi:hypothetical protein